MTDSSGMMPLHHAVDRGHIECVKLILNYPNTTLGLTGLKPALDLARENDFPEISQLLEQARERLGGGGGAEGGAGTVGHWCCLGMCSKASHRRRLELSSVKSSPSWHEIL